MHVAGKVTEVWKDDKGRRKWYAHILYEDDDEEDLELSEALELVVNKQKQEELAEDVERLQNKKKRVSACGQCYFSYRTM